MIRLERVIKISHWGNISLYRRNYYTFSKSKTLASITVFT